MLRGFCFRFVEFFRLFGLLKLLWRLLNWAVG
jgi:hypothetical protein